MTRDPIRRRFGKGAGRLRVGMPAAAERLSALSRTPIRHERRLTVVPVATAALVLWLLATSPLMTPPLAAPDEIQVVLDAWPVTPFVEPVPDEPKTERLRERPRKAPAEPAFETFATRTPTGPAPTAKPEPQAPFDPTALATRAPTFTKAAILPAPGVDTSRSTVSPGAAQAPTRAMPAGLTTAARPVVPAEALSEGLTSSAIASAPDRHRPGADNDASGTSADLVATTHLGDRDRRAFLDAIARDAATSNSGAGAPAPSSRRPQVSAQGTGVERLELASRGAQTSSGTALDGWQEVPLDELPDCTPAGRQDLLKKRILLAAPFQRECSHRDGSYRFVETRNLGAFLMWSRPNPGTRAGQPRDRDACDVLERALACLGDRSSQESSSR